jgi:hypothetical protein
VTLGGAESVIELVAPETTSIGHVTVEVPSYPGYPFSTLGPSDGYEALIYLNDGDTQIGGCSILGNGTGLGQAAQPDGSPTLLNTCTATFGAVTLNPGDTITVINYPVNGGGPVTQGSVAAGP